MNNYSAFMYEVHQNAVDHGFWDPEPDMATFCALLHCEISEAMEEWRAGRPNVYTGKDGKPEGIAVELADVALRIMDRLPEMGVKEMWVKTFDDGVMADVHSVTTFEDAWSSAGAEYPKEPDSFPSFICRIHRFVDAVLSAGSEIVRLCGILTHIKVWFLQEGLDFEATLRLKHEYNKTRPYKHGKKV